MSSARTWLSGAACLIAALLIVPVQDRIDAHWNRPSIDPDLLYFSSPAALKTLALGYDSLLADVYWMRAIQYYGRRDEAARRQVHYKNLPKLLDIVTTLDPKMLDVYLAGCYFLSEPDPVGAGAPLEAIALLDKGIADNPREWRLWFNKGFIYFWFLKDYKQAGQTWLGASRISSAPPWLEALAARGFSQGGAMETAKDLWRRELENAKREDLKENAKNHLASIKVDEDLWTLEYFLKKYKAEHGSSPSSLESLVRAGFIRYVPEDPSGVPYYYDRETGTARLSVESKVRYLELPYDYRAAFLEKLAREQK